MKKFSTKITTLLLLTVLILPLTSTAQESRGTDTTHYEATVEVEANYNNSRSNRSTSNPDDTNVCDGVTCPDGSCAATSDQCLTPATISPDIYTGDTEVRGEAPARGTDMDSDGTPDFRDMDSDGDSIPDREDTRRPSRPNENGDDIDSDGVIEKGQDYNSTRSNRRKNAFGDLDRDKIPEVAMRAGGFIKLDDIKGEATASSRVGDGSVYCWGKAEANDGTTYNWGRGLCVALESIDEVNATATARISAIQVRGDEVRNWTEEQRRDWENYKNQREEANDREQRVINHLIEQTQRDERIREMRADSEGVEMDYRAEMRLLGLFPIHREVTAETTLNGEVEIKYPWYSFLSRKPDREHIKTLLLDTVNLI